MAYKRLTLPFDGRKARTVRERRGLNLRDVVARTREAGTPIGLATLSRWENGIDTPNGARRLQVLAAALNCNIDDLLTPPSEAVKECA